MNCSLPTGNGELCITRQACTWSNAGEPTPRGTAPRPGPPQLVFPSITCIAAGRTFQYLILQTINAVPHSTIYIAFEVFLTLGRSARSNAHHPRFPYQYR